MAAIIKFVGYDPKRKAKSPCTVEGTSTSGPPDGDYREGLKVRRRFGRTSRTAPESKNFRTSFFCSFYNPKTIEKHWSEAVRRGFVDCKGRGFPSIVGVKNKIRAD